jgi:hypothetical protein
MDQMTQTTMLAEFANTYYSPVPHVPWSPVAIDHESLIVNNKCTSSPDLKDIDDTIKVLKQKEGEGKHNLE